MLESAVALHAFGQHFFAGMSEGRMPQVVRERNRLGQVFIQPERARDSAADRCHLDRVGQTRPQMIAGAVQENLRLVFQAAESAGMNDPGPVALKGGPVSVLRLGKLAARRLVRLLRIRREDVRFVRFHLLARLPARRHRLLPGSFTA